MAVAFNILGGATPIRFRFRFRFRLRKPYSKSFAIHVDPKIRIFPVRAQNNKLPSSAIDVGFDYSGRRVTIGDVVNKEDNAVYVSPTNNAESLLEKGKVAAAFLFKLSFWASLAASSVAGLPVAVSAFFIYIIFRIPEAGRVPPFYVDVIKHVCSGKVVENVLSSALGDGDPNQGIEKKRWKMIGQYIALNGGVVTAEEIVPYLDPRNTENTDDESYMLPVLQLFNGHPKVDQEGNILYHFPSVHCTPLPRRDCGNAYAGRWVDLDIQVDKFLKEKKWKFGTFSIEEDESVYSIIFYNLLCSMLWGSATMLRNGSRSYMSRVFLSLLTMYVIYLVSLLVFSNGIASSVEKINAEITKRNEVRESRAKALELPDLFLKRKLSSAREMARKASIGNNRIVYKFENEIYEQQDYERQEWDRRLKMKIQKERHELDRRIKRGEEFWSLCSELVHSLSHLLSI